MFITSLQMINWLSNYIFEVTAGQLEVSKRNISNYIFEVTAVQLEVSKRNLSSESTMSKLTLISTFCILIVGATGIALDQADQVRCP